MRPSYICPSLSTTTKDKHMDYGEHRRGRDTDMLQLEELEVEMELDLLDLFLLLMSPSSFCGWTSRQCRHILLVMQDHTLTQDQLREVQGQLNRMEHALMDRVGISFAPAPPRDVPAEDSETDDDLDD
ncbi:hypothetical protein Scep_004566 [Stephania cephalantha]|uniref:Uncharacterized protein n=1 Tax=Stephania cephalantha TaxID=152367 RepID=A0AAP0KSR1_9MAGN